MEVPEHIVAHCIQVCRVAMLLVDHLKIGEKNLNRPLIEAAALLHDITKMKSLEGDKGWHDQTGADYVEKLGYSEVANLVRQHVRLDEYFPSDCISDAEIVNYSDKRVLHDKVVPLVERGNYIIERYAVTEAIRQRVQTFWKKTEDLEKRLFSRLPFSPEELSSRLGCEDCCDELSAYHDVCKKISESE